MNMFDSFICKIQKQISNRINLFLKSECMNKRYFIISIERRAYYG